MGFFKGLLEGLLGGGKTPAAELKAEAPATLKADIVPDKPVEFAFKNSWICVKSDSPQQVIEALGIKNVQESNCASGIDYADDMLHKVFVAPAINGWVLVVGYPTYDGSDPADDNERLAQLSQNFPELQAFETHRVVDLQMWAKFRQGMLVRGYGWLGESGEVLMNIGGLTTEEQQLGFDNIITDADADWDNVELPDEMSVCGIAAAWGVDPLFTGDSFPEGTGYIGTTK